MASNHLNNIDSDKKVDLDALDFSVKPEEEDTSESEEDISEWGKLGGTLNVKGSCTSLLINVWIEPHTLDEDPNKPGVDPLLPERASQGSAGYDVKAKRDMFVSPDSVIKVPTGVYLRDVRDAFTKEPAQVVLFSKERSGRATRKETYHLLPRAGVIDVDYRGEIHIPIHNLARDRTYKIKAGEKIAQIVILPFVNVNWLDNSKLSPTEVSSSTTDRGNHGFGEMDGELQLANGERIPLDSLEEICKTQVASEKGVDQFSDNEAAQLFQDLSSASNSLLHRKWICVYNEENKQVHITETFHNGSFGSPILHPNEIRAGLDKLCEIVQEYRDSEFPATITTLTEL